MCSKPNAGPERTAASQSSSTDGYGVVVRDLVAVSPARRARGVSCDVSTTSQDWDQTSRQRRSDKDNSKHSRPLSVSTYAMSSSRSVRDVPLADDALPETRTSKCTLT